ncbi:unnamed protein product [Phytomonas sp. Hart1]|nr:unnamed protein product [Phytomonas sp. Hart1]|eukprot:CCW71067.1 unnamed protein product [Phytomonas sp. isolate Hart1]
MDKLQTAINRISAFGLADDLEARKVVAELELVSQHASAHSLQFSEELMCQCIDLLEELPRVSIATGALIMLLANACLIDENLSLASRYGLPALCVLVLQSQAELSNETLFYMFDLMSTLSSREGYVRQCLRPGIPYVLEAMKQRMKSLDVLFGGCFLLSTMTILDESNCELTVRRGGMQVVINIYRYALKRLSELTMNQKTNTGLEESTRECVLAHLKKEKQAEYVHLCKGILRWCKNILQNLCRADSPTIDATLPTLDYGQYGTSIEMDDLKWTLVFERKKRKTSIEPLA